MKFCYACGSPLIMKDLEHEGEVAYCQQCRQYRFPIYHSAVSMVVLNPNEDKILMIQQYGKKDNILVAGYINQKESAEKALKREMKEELGRSILKQRFMCSEYFPKTNTLIWNFAVVIDSEDLSQVSDWEVDKAQWFSFEEAITQVKPDSSAQRFLNNFLQEYKIKSKDFFA